MIELFASDSAAGARRQGLVMADEKYGEVEEILSLTLDLDVGDLTTAGRDTDGRLPDLANLYSHFPGVPEIIARLNRHAMDKLLQAAEAGKTIRFWACETDPSEMCTLYFLCHLLEETKAELRVVRVVKEILKGQKVVRYRSTGEIAPEDFHLFLREEETLPPLKRALYAAMWEEQVNMNAPLRACINGRVVGVPADFYDFAIRVCLPEGEFKAAVLIGMVLKQISGVSDAWIYRRILHLTEAGELERVSGPQNGVPYSDVYTVVK
jgi:hypothetical protein